MLAECQRDNACVIAANFRANDFMPDYVFCSNMRRFVRMQGKMPVKFIVTSNLRGNVASDLTFNFASYISKEPDIIDNSGLMILKILSAAGVKQVAIAGMDGYTLHRNENYFDWRMEEDSFADQATRRNQLIAEELRVVGKSMKLNFITPTVYKTV